MNKLKKELTQRGTADITNGIVNQVTQALDEKPDKVTFLIFGEMQTKSIMPIDAACAKCTHCYFDTPKKCQERQSIDAKSRGFNNLVCPEQFID
ncbi:MAG: hypothetical protein WC479_07385 [Candidatus Izemoplasmatales bacterium]